ncbi:MAG: OB-fold nucleic acid binding domain-containing protein [Intrasporangium sp.]|uniref:OB-fold nucleic acid binding domain-containing protein n=1 Tax=Intrasporangium sp. TaxID=1925024 RepID=UPI002648AD12|nr:OB-fold nucleic acid binding domain-containing protein [Intrasporangium sp.]MDN5798048.1 OB-fold nucleic acid binding domain-containing protein [Intrasporangium sp.]
MPAEPNNALGRLAKRLLRSSDEIDSDELARESRDLGRQHIGGLVPRTVASVRGEIRSITLRPAEEVAALDAELWDGTDVLHLVWLGRRSIPGVTPGVKLEATGRVCRHHDVLTIFNPSYEVIGREGHHDG